MGRYAPGSRAARASHQRAAEKLFSNKIGLAQQRYVKSHRNLLRGCLKSRDFTNRSSMRLECDWVDYPGRLDSALVILASVGTFQTPSKLTDSVRSDNGACAIF